MLFLFSLGKALIKVGGADLEKSIQELHKSHGDLTEGSGMFAIESSFNFFLNF